MTIQTKGKGLENELLEWVFYKIGILRDNWHCQHVSYLLFPDFSKIFLKQISGGNPFVLEACLIFSLATFISIFR